MVRDHHKRNKWAACHHHLHSRVFPRSNYKLASMVLLECSTQQPQTNTILLFDVHKLPRLSFFVLVHLSKPGSLVFYFLTVALYLFQCLSIFPYVLLKFVHFRSYAESFCLSFGSHGHGHHLHSLYSLYRCIRSHSRICKNLKNQNFQQFCHFFGKIFLG